MNKAELIEAVQQELGADCTKTHAEKAVNAVLDTIGEGLTETGSVQLIGFGTFTVKDRAERTGLNPQTKQPIIIPATKAVSFKPGAKLKEKVVTNA